MIPYSYSGLIPRVPERALALAHDPDVTLPAYADVAWRYQAPEPQGATPHCVAYSVCAIGQAHGWHTTGHRHDYDEAAVYDEAKKKDGMPGVSGTTEEAGFDAALALGVFPAGTRRHALRSRVDVIEGLHRHLWVCAGFRITEAWTASMMHEGRMPVLTAQTLGYHEVVIVGFAEGVTDLDGVHILNWWGRHWGDDGFGFLPWRLFDRTFLGGSAIEFPERVR